MKLTLKNFQCHRHLSLELGKVTVLVGPSNVGKSAVVRALGFLTGQLSVGANRLVTRGEKQMVVSLEMDEKVYQREFSPSGISVKVGDVIYPRMGNVVPEELTRLATIQGQFDPPFLITDTPTNIYRKVSEELEFEKLLKIIELVQKECYQCKQSLESLQSREQYLRNKLATLEPLVDISRRLLGLYCVARLLQYKLAMQLRELLVTSLLIRLSYLYKLRARLSQWQKRVLLYRLHILQRMRQQRSIVEVYRLHILWEMRKWRSIVEVYRLYILQRMRQRRSVVILYKYGVLRSLYFALRTQRVWELGQRYLALTRLERCPTCGRPLNESICGGQS